VVLLLKSSDRVAHDLAAIAAMPPALRPAPQLALRKWYELRPEREFRCFVRGRQLAAISQRDPTQFFPQLQGETRAAIQAGIAAFVRQHVLPAFPLEHYTCDVYVATTGAVRLVDFNPVGATTSPLLFSWEELYPAGPAAAASQQEQDAAAGGGGSSSSSSSGGGGSSSSGGGGGSAVQRVVMRVVEDASTLQAGHKSAVAMPYDMLGLAHTVDDIMQQMRAQEQQRQAAGGGSS
jgi:hypothetical protein